MVTQGRLRDLVDAANHVANEILDLMSDSSDVGGLLEMDFASAYGRAIELVDALEELADE